MEGELAVSEVQRLQSLRTAVIQRLEALEEERSGRVREGDPEGARTTLRAFQEVARVLETIDEILKH